MYGDCCRAYDDVMYTQNKHIESNDDVGGSKVTQPRVFRQYMNR